MRTDPAMNKDTVPVVWLLVNEWLVWDKFEQQYAALEAAAARLGAFTLVRVTNDEVCAQVGSLADAALPAACIVIDKDAHALALLESRGVRLFNSAAAVAACDDKLLTFAALAKEGIGQPDTLAIPYSFRTLSAKEWEDSAFLAQAEARLGYPLVLKHAVGSWGQGVFLIAGRGQLLEHLTQESAPAMLVQEYVADSTGVDVRLFMVGDRCVAAMQRRGPEGDFRANITGGGTGSPHTPTAEELDVARRAMAALGLDTGSVDFFLTSRGAVVCEVNSNAQFMTLQEVTGVDVAAEIIAHVARYLSARGS